jgi:uncharacterized SAM-binding protein YcdF (DUF218 family)
MELARSREQGAKSRTSRVTVTTTSLNRSQETTLWRVRKSRTVCFGALLLAVIVLATFARVPILRTLGSFLVVEDPLREAGAIVTLGGGPPFREMEAARLYRAGWAPFVVLVRAARREESKVFEDLGITLGEKWELSREVLMRLGVPAAAIVVPDDEVAGTLEELQAVWDELQRAKSKGQGGSSREHGAGSMEQGAEDQTSEVGDQRSEISDQRPALSKVEGSAVAPVILVTSKYHTRRTRLTWHYVTGGRSQAIVRAASGDPFDPSRWWQERRFVLSVVREYLGLANYYMGFPVAP